MALSLIPPSAINWNDELPIPDEHALFVAAAPALKVWIPMIQRRHRAFIQKTPRVKSRLDCLAILLFEGSSRLGRFFTESLAGRQTSWDANLIPGRVRTLPTKVLSSSPGGSRHNNPLVLRSRDTTTVRAPNPEACRPDMALQINEHWLFDILLNKHLTNLEKTTLREIGSFTPTYAHGLRPSPSRENTVRVVELGAFGIRIKLSTIRHGRPCWDEAIQTPCEPAPDFDLAELLLPVWAGLWMFSDLV